MQAVSFQIEDNQAERLAAHLDLHGITAEQWLKPWLDEVDRGTNFSESNTAEENALALQILKRKAKAAKGARNKA